MSFHLRAEHEGRVCLHRASMHAPGLTLDACVTPRRVCTLSPKLAILAMHWSLLSAAAAMVAARRSSIALCGSSLRAFGGTCSRMFAGVRLPCAARHAAWEPSAFLAKAGDGCGCHKYMRWL